jgi:hypothetical protein
MRNNMVPHTAPFLQFRAGMPQQINGNVEFHQLPPNATEFLSPTPSLWRLVSYDNEIHI